MHINLSIREIANGVLVSTGCGDLYDPTNPGESFFPNMEAVYAAVPDLLREAHARSITLRARQEDQEREKREAYERGAGDSFASAWRESGTRRGSGAISAGLGRALAENERAPSTGEKLFGAECAPEPLDPVMPEVRERLPEEAAALGDAPAPVIYDDEASEPVRPVHVEPAAQVEEDDDATEYRGTGFTIGEGFTRPAPEDG